MFNWPILQFKWGPFRFGNLRRASCDILKVFKRNKLDFSKHNFFFCYENKQTKLHIFPMCIFNECKFFANFSIFCLFFKLWCILMKQIPPWFGAVKGNISHYLFFEDVFSKCLRLTVFLFLLFCIAVFIARL